jgi:signal transduction histidine kinase
MPPESPPMSGEIRQPLTAIVVNCSAALAWLKRTAPDLGRAQEALQDAVAASSLLEDVIRGMRAMFGNESTTRSPVDLNELVRQVLTLTAHQIASNKIVTQTNLTDDVRPVVMADPIQLQQVILNLIMNAIEAMSSSDQGTRTLRLATGIDQARNGVLIVEDSGPGIDPKIADKLFEPFVTTKSGGMGMGLSICKSIIEAHGGKLAAGAGEQRGTRFQITLRLVRKDTSEKQPAMLSQ